MNRTTIMAVVMAVCLLAVPIASGAVAAQTADEPTNETDTNETTDSDDTSDDDASDADGSEDTDDENDTDDVDDNETDIAFAYDATLDNGTVTVTVIKNNSPVENATVVVNETTVGATDRNGTLGFELDNRSAVELAVTVDDVTQMTVYAVEDGSLVTQDDDEGPPTELPEPVPDQVSTIHELITAFQNGEYDKLGPIVSSAAGNGNAPEEPGNSSGNAPERGNDSGSAPAQAGNAGNAPGQADRSAENAPGNAGNAPDDAGASNTPDRPSNAGEAGDDEDDDSEVDAPGSNGNGNGPSNAGNAPGNGGTGSADNGGGTA